MLPKSGSSPPKRSKLSPEAEYVARISEALRSELGTSRRATKTIVRWTGACDRTARTWVNGEGGPSGVHLLSLARESSAVWEAVQIWVGREEGILGADLHAVEVALAKAHGALEVLRRQRLKGR